ncbi:MAG: hypothetical protein KF841_15725 [Phycisphaerae bacterium]|nr:hypothetical protein [Phycisphaerae bacterium]
MNFRSVPIRAFPAAIAVCLCMAAGCQSTLRVRVEKLEGVQSSVPDGLPDTLRILLAALEGLDEICTECRITYGDAAVESALSALADSQRKGRALLPIIRDLIDRQARGQIGGRALAAQTAALHRRVRALIPRIDLDALSTVIPIEIEPAQRAAMQRLAADLPVVVDRFATALASAAAGSAGFGGFRQGGVFQINPGDPAYDRVLVAVPAANPITEVRVRAVGDTGVMLVQESPAQMRLYQISNDPSTIMRNASFIMNKVLQAAVKFSGWRMETGVSGP